MSRYAMSLAVLAFAIMFGASCSKAPPVIQFKPAPNSVRTVDISTAETKSFGMGGGGMKLSNSDEVTVEISTEGFDPDGTANLKATFVSYKQDTTGMEDALQSMPPQTKSQMGDDPFGKKALAEALQSLKGQSFTVRVDKHGRLLEVSGCDAIAKKIADQVKASTGPGGELAIAVLTKQLGDSGVKDMLTAVFPARPDVPLKVGDKRSGKTVKLEDFFPITEAFDMTVSQNDGTSLVADMQRTYSIDPQTFKNEMKKSHPEMKGLFDTNKLLATMEKQMKDEDFSKLLSGNGSGSATFDVPTGWLVKSNITGQMTGMGDKRFKIEVHTYPK